MPRYAGLKKIFVIGSGPIVIGQGCEFDYSGTQACKALREEGCHIILLNSNPATIMTDRDIADATYVAPMTVETCEEIIRKEKPDALLPTLGGQTALNLSVALARSGFLEQQGVRLIGASLTSIEKAENRKLFREAMQRIHLETATAHTVTSLEEIKKIKNQLHFPIMIRTSFTLGGLGSGIVQTWDELMMQCQSLFSVSDLNAIELEESLVGWKEFEMEAIRDHADNCIVVCSLENVDPMGIHTGDSITVAPAQTLCNKMYQRMREATFAVLREVGVDTGGANVQFAVHPDTGRMVVIEMNPRVSRSSALASKATGYPIARIAAKLALGYTLDELENVMTGDAIPASFEPTIDYVVVKFPRFNFEKFPQCSGILTTKMQSTGEVIGFGRNFQEALQKAITSVEKNFFGLKIKNISSENILQRITQPYHDRLFYVAEAFRKKISVEVVYEKTKIDRWFLEQIQELILLEENSLSLSEKTLRLLKRKGFSDRYLADRFQCDEWDIRQKRKDGSIFPVYKRIDSCAAEFPAKTACFYSTYDQACEALPTNRKKILIIGSGPNRIGQGIEFDYGSVHAALASREAGYETIMINSNPETVSTDYDTVDRLYLEPLTLEYVLNVIEKEKPDGVMTSFGGQTALNLIFGLQKANATLLGTQAAAVDLCENRDLFQKKIHALGLRQPDNFCVYNAKEWEDAAKKIIYPVIVRPSYLLSGSAMQIIPDEKAFLSHLKMIAEDEKYFPILVERFLERAIEVEVDGICDGENVFIPGVMEQLEEAGIHSGDSTCCFPAHTLSDALQKNIIEQASRLALACQIMGPFNVQFALQGETIFVIELNPRSSRTVPFLSKALGFSVAKIAARCLLGESLQTQGFLKPITPAFFSFKIPVFPFDRLAPHALGPEMRSTGEMMLMQKKIAEKIDLTRFDILALQDV